MTHARRALVAGELPPSPEHGTQEAKMYQPDLENKAIDPATDTKETDGEPSTPDIPEPALPEGSPDAAEPVQQARATIRRTAQGHKIGEVPLASDEAGQLISRLNLSWGRFWGETPESPDGFTVADVKRIAGIE